MILEGDAIAEPDKKRYKEKAQITVSTKRTFEAASVYKGTKQQYTISHRLQIRVAEWSVVQMRRKSACADVPGCLSA